MKGICFIRVPTRGTPTGILKSPFGGFEGGSFPFSRNHIVAECCLFVQIPFHLLHGGIGGSVVVVALTRTLLPARQAAGVELVGVSVARAEDGGHMGWHSI
jgi:hypothetical protein